MRVVKAFFVYLFGLFICQGAWAICNGAAVPALPSIRINVQQQQGSTGDVMISNAWHLGTSINFVNCTDSTLGARYFLAVDLLNSIKWYKFEGENYLIYPSSDPDVGVIYAFAFQGQEYVPYGIRDIGNSAILMGTGEGMKMNLLYRFRYVSLKRLKVGELVLSGARFSTRFYQEGNPIERSSSYLSIPSTALSVNNTSCSLKYPSQIALKKANLSLLPTVGSAGEGADFQLRVTCGASYGSYKVLYTMSDVNAPSNMTSNLKVGQAAGAASGVELQIMDGEKLVVFGSPNSSLAPKGVLGAMDTKGGELSKSFTVRYIRTAERITPGTVTAAVSVTLSYE